MNNPTLSKEDIQQEQDLIAEAKRRPEAFKPLYDRYYPVMFRYIYNKTRDKELTADLTSQVFLKALLHLSKYKNQNLPFAAWLYRVASNEVAQHFRDANKLRVVVLEEGLLSEIGEDGGDLGEEGQEALKRAVQQLTLEEIQVLDLRFQEARSFREVGQVLNITENYAKVKTYRILDKLRALLSKIPDGMQ